jgi:hypothetical protein
MQEALKRGRAGGGSNYWSGLEQTALQEDLLWLIFGICGG